MDNQIQDKHEKKLECIKRMNIEQEKVVRKLKEALDFFENVQIMNEESLDNIKKPLDDLLSKVKYLPVEQGPCFNDLPVEIKMKIFNYSCDMGAFVAAAVCQDWKHILVETHLVDLGYVSIGKRCYTGYGYRPSCEDCSCFMPEEKLKASVVLGLDIPLAICYPVTDVDSNLIVEALMSVSDFKIIRDCDCSFDDHGPLLNRSQTKDLFEALEKKTDINSMEIKGLDMRHLDQDKLIDCLFKIKNLTLAEGSYSNWIERKDRQILDFDRFVEKLLQASINSTTFKLTSLHLDYMPYPKYLSEHLANALCNVEIVTIGPYLPLRFTTLIQMIENVLNGGMRMKALFIVRDFDWPSLISSEYLTMFVTRMEQLELRGSFSREQVDKVKSLPGVEANECKIWKDIL